MTIRNAVNPSPLRLNVGFLLKENPGYSRTIEIDVSQANLDGDFVATNLHGTLTFTRTHEGLYVQGQLRAHTQVECARCLADAEVKVRSQLEELFYYPPKNAPADSLIIPEDHNLDFTPLVRADMLVSVPMRALCRPDCKGLCPTCGQNWNDGPCDCDRDDSDPRWGALKNLLDDPSTP